MTAPALPYVTREGARHDLKDQAAEFVIIFFNDPDCDECAMIKLRLDADVKATALQEAGRLKIVSISPLEAEDEWRSKVSGYPSAWEVGATPEADNVYDLRQTPSIYLLDRNHRILAKNLSLDVLLHTLGAIK